MAMMQRKASGGGQWREGRPLHCLPALTIIFVISAEQEPLHVGSALRALLNINRTRGNVAKVNVVVSSCVLGSAVV